MSEQPTVETEAPRTGTAHAGSDTVHARTETADAGTVPAGTEPARRRGPDVLTLLTGLVCLVVALMAITGWSPDISFDPRWVLAGGAVALGAALLVSSIRSRP